MYRQVAKLWKNPENTGLEEELRRRAIHWRRGPTVVRVEHALRPNRAHALGYRAKQGYVIVRVRVRRGGLRKQRPRMGRRPKRMGVVRYTPAKSLKEIAEGRVAKRYPNLKVLNSYWIWEDGKYKWYEVILVDPHHPSIKSDPKISWIAAKP
ncbi:MAG: 50S ribosomal protein L15e [Candidatus Bathyarchaeia archaeon]